MEKVKDKSWNIESEEDLYVKFRQMYDQLWKDNFFIDQKDSNEVLKKLSLIEQRAREFGVVSPNEEIEGRYLRKTLKC